MTSRNEFERILTTWLVDEAPGREPEGLLPRTLVHVRRSRRHPVWLATVRGTAIGRAAAPARLVLVLLLISLLVAAAVGGALIGSRGRLPIGPLPPTPVPTWGSSLPQVFGLPGQFAFASNRDGDFDVYTMRPDRTNLVQVTNGAGDDVAPLWSPDGRQIAFSSNRDGDANIYLINADGTAEMRLTSAPGDEILGAWSPDGSQLAFVANRGSLASSIGAATVGIGILVAGSNANNASTPIIIVAGISHNTAGLAVREKIAFRPAELLPILNSIRDESRLREGLVPLYSRGSTMPLRTLRRERT